MQVVVCALAKNEHKYINEWVNHYVKLGVDKIYLYDNDEVDSPYIGDFIDNKSKVEIINIRGICKEKLQHDIYTTFYNTYRNTFNWCLFCDIDEFLFGVDNIKTWLARYKNVFQIRIKWKLFGDDDQITRDMNKSVVESFKNVVTSSLNRDLIHKGTLENQGKMIVRGGMSNVVIRSPHFASFMRRDNIVPSVLPSGRVCNSKVVIVENYSHETIYLHHYMTKTLSEFIEQKMGRTDAVYGDKIKLNYYWRINKKTPTKEYFIQQYFK